MDCAKAHEEDFSLVDQEALVMKKIQLNSQTVSDLFHASLGWNIYLDTEIGETLMLGDEYFSQLEELSVEWDSYENVAGYIQQEIDESDQPDLLDALKVEWYSERYLRSPLGEDSYRAYDDMRDFVMGIEDDALRERLLYKIQGRGAFGRFKRGLVNHPKVRAEWFEFQAERQRYHVRRWLEGEGFEVEFV
jgi:hypothetical protein